MPLDSAVYHPGIDKIMGTMGPYLVKCNAATGAREDFVRVAAPIQGPCRCVYHAATGFIYVATWFDPSWVDISAVVMSPRTTIVAVDADTMAVGGSFNLPTLFGDLTGFARQGMNGLRDIISNGSYLYFAFRFQDGGGQLFRIDPSNTANRDTDIGASWQTWDGGQNISIDGADIYWGDTGAQNLFMSPLDFTGAPTAEVNLSTDDETPLAVARVGSDTYAVCGNGTLIKATSYDAGGPGVYATFNLEAVSFGCKPFRIRYNSVDGLLYIPCQNTDAVIVWNPGIDSGTLESGFDGPVDVCFTPSRVFAVQSGPTGLREV